jgi:hypothetical protein
MTSQKISRSVFLLRKTSAGGRTRLFCYAKKSSVPPRSEYREQVLDILSLRRPVEPTVLALIP